MNAQYPAASRQSHAPPHRWVVEAAASLACLSLAVALAWTDNWALLPLIAIGLLACLTFMVLAARHAPGRIQPWLYAAAGVPVALGALLLAVVVVVASSFSSG